MAIEPRLLADTAAAAIGYSTCNRAISLAALDAVTVAASEAAAGEVTGAVGSTLAAVACK